MSEGAHTAETFDRERPLYEGDWKDLYIEHQRREASTYDRPGGVDAEPGSLEDFAGQLEGDVEEYKSTRDAITNHYFNYLIHQQAMTGGYPADPAVPGLPEASDFLFAYSQLENAMRLMAFQIEGGLTGLQMGASFIHMAYELADVSSAGSLGSPFAEYGGVLQELGSGVDEVFGPSSVEVAADPSLDRSGSSLSDDVTELTDEEQQAIEEQWQRHLSGDGPSINETEGARGTMPEEAEVWDRAGQAEAEVGAGQTAEDRTVEPTNVELTVPDGPLPPNNDDPWDRP